MFRIIRLGLLWHSRGLSAIPDGGVSLVEALQFSRLVKSQYIRRW